MNDGIEWRFGNTGYQDEDALDTGDVETFKKDPIASLARETCQNSLDARAGEEPVIIEFKVFDINKNDVNNIGIQELEERICACYEFEKDDPKENAILKAMKEYIAQDKIKILRISDFNTKGLEGIEDGTKRGTDFYNLTKGSGVSGKSGTSGGSKGIGKFASFVVSKTNTVYYSSKTKNGSGFIGITKLRSIPINPDDPDDTLLSTGKGSYGNTKKSLPIEGELKLDPSFSREENQYGTDIFLLGFDDIDDWKRDILIKVLESFMVAIYRGNLVVAVDDIVIDSNPESIRSIIYKEDFDKNRKLTGKKIRAQFELLEKGDAVKNDTLIINGSEVEIYIKSYTSQNENESINRCIAVRSPYMMIDEIGNKLGIPYSAMCIIGDNELNRRLREIENPQHTSWEINRLNHDKNRKAETKAIKNQFIEAVEKYIRESLISGEGKPIDLEGASDFLPDYEESGTGDISSQIKEDIEVKPLKRPKVNVPKTQKISDAGEGYDFDTGDENGDEEGIRVPHEGGDTPEPNPYPHDEPKDEDTGSSEGDKTILKKVELQGMRPRIAVTNKHEGKIDIIIDSIYDEQDCEIQLRLVGATDDKYPIEIRQAIHQDEECEIIDGRIVHFSLCKGERFVISCVANIDGMFGSEVIVNAYR